jgi:hypothetical protein
MSIVSLLSIISMPVAPEHEEGKAAHHYVFGLVDLSTSVHSKIILTYTSQGEGWRFESQLGYLR